MWTRGLLLAVLAGLACEADDPGAACEGTAPVQILATDNAQSLARATADGTLVVHYGDDLDGEGTYGGPACGVERTLTLPGIHLFPARVAFDPQDDDPDLVCDQRSGRFYRVDFSGEAPPTLVLPYLRCPGVPTLHGPLFRTDGHPGDPLLLLPDFPDDASAVAVASEVRGFQVVDGWLYHLDFEAVLRRTDLETRETEVISDEAAWFTATATHALVRSNVDPDIAPMRVVDVAAGTRAYVGLFRADEDEHALPRVTMPWSFDPTGRYVIHAGGAPSPIEAYDLAGAPVAFPAQGQRVLAHSDGTFVIVDAGGTTAARPGDPRTAALDFVPDPEVDEGLAFVGGRLEAVIDGDLHEVPLDGAPRRLLARGIGTTRTWIDDRHILTIHDGTLVTVLAPTNARRIHSSYVAGYELVPDRGLYFNRFEGFAAPKNGVWFVPEAALYPRLPPCTTGYWCR